MHAGAPAAAPRARTAAAYPKGKYVSYAPYRFFDTRSGKPLGQRGTSTLTFDQGVPQGATAVVFNLTATGTSANTFVSAWPSGQPRPNTAAINLGKGATRSNQVVVPLGKSNGKPAVSFYNNTGNAHLIGDLEGFYSSSQPGATGYAPSGPKRVLDTRSGSGPIGAGKETVLDLSKAVPDGTNAVTLNVTGIARRGDTYLTVYPEGEKRPQASSVSIGNGQTTPNFVTVGLRTSKKLHIYNNHGSTDVLADLSGYYGADGKASYQPINPKRIVDTRTAGGALGPRTARDFPASVPSNASAATVNLTGITPSQDTYLSAYPANTQRPTASTLNLRHGETASNAGNVPLNDGKFAIYNANGSAQAAADLNGFFLP